MFTIADAIKNRLERAILGTSSAFSDKNGLRSRKLSVEKSSIC